MKDNPIAMRIPTKTGIVIKKRIVLNQSMYIDYGCAARCKCGRTIMYSGSEFEPCSMYYCKVCDLLVVVVDHDGFAYYIGERVFPEHQKWAPPE